MKSSAKNIQMTSFDDLFGSGNPAEKDGESVREMELDKLVPFKNHPFKVFDDEAMQETVASIKKYGILVPGIARPKADGSYELIAGHRRKFASQLAGKTTMPVLIRELDEDEAILSMVDSNLQRENLLPSEKAWAYRMKLEAIRRKAGRPSQNNSGQVVQNLKGKRSVEIVAENTGENYKQIQRYIRLTELLPTLLSMVDDKKLPFNPAVELSYLKQEEQKKLLELMQKLSAVPSLEQAKRLKKFSQEEKLSGEVMEAILTEEPSSIAQVTLKKDKLKQYFPKTYSPKQMEDVIFSLLEAWRNRQENKQ